MKLPQAFMNNMENCLGEEFQAYVNSFEQPSWNGLRVNSAKISPEKFCQMTDLFLHQVPWVTNGFYYEDTVSPARHPHYYAGLYYLQEPSAMTPANRLPVEPGDRVLDLCAAPGGKATELGARLQGKGMLLANDISNSRAKALLKNLEIQGIPNILVTSEEPEKLVSRYPAFFDKILIDAPCSGEGMFRREPKMIEYWEEHGPDYYQPIQKKLVRQAYQMLRPGGLMLYSTCTFSVAENEEVIAGLLNEYPDLSLESIEPYSGFQKGYSCGGQEMSSCIHIYPHRMQGEGHFLALIRKAERSDGQNRRAISDRKTGIRLPSEAEKFLQDCLYDFTQGNFYMVKDQLYYIGKDVEMANGLRYLRTGLLVGNVSRKRFEPSQALAMAMKKEEFRRVIDFASDDIRTIKYLKGETILLDQPEEGWILVCTDGYPLGWGKASGTTLKNKYYAGWRMV